MHRVRTLLIDDSPFMRQVIGDIISSDAEIDLVGTASNGKQGTTMALELQPDVVVTDMIMPEYDGMYVVRSVMEKQPVPIILLSSLEKTNQLIFDALQQGAFEFIDKPSDLDTESIRHYPLVSLIKQAARVDKTLLVKETSKPRNSSAHAFDSNLHYDIVVIGASTGGPGAVESIIANLPNNLQVPIVIAQHMPARFLETFAQRLNDHSSLTIKLARKGDALHPGVVYIAPGEQNIRVEVSALNGLPIITFTNRKYDEFNYPSVNCLFESVAETFGARSIGVLLTGMGKDGAEGLKKIKQHGGYTIAQDENSSVVYGMPKVAVEIGAVKQIVPLDQIAGFVISCL